MQKALDLNPKAPTPSPTADSFDWLDVRRFLNDKKQDWDKSAHYPFEDIPATEEAGFLCDWHFSRKTVGIGVKGRLEGTFDLTCDTCEQAFFEPVSVLIDEMYVLETFVDDNHGREKELLADDFYESVADDGQIDLKNLVHQYLTMEIVHHRLCVDCQST